jgi:hypothetical protein
MSNHSEIFNARSSNLLKISDGEPVVLSHSPPFDKPALSEPEAERTVRPFESLPGPGRAGRTVFSECPERSRRKGSPRTEKANDFNINSVHPRLPKTFFGGQVEPVEGCF